MRILPWNHRVPVLRVVTPPAMEPLSLAEAKQQIRLEQDFSDEDDYLYLLIGAARRFCERRKSYCLVEQTLEYSIDWFPHYPLDGLVLPYPGSNLGIGLSAFAIELPRATPLRSILSVYYSDSNGVAALWDASNYRAETSRTPGLLVPNYGVSYPSFTPQNQNAVKIQYVAGPALLSPSDEIDPCIKLAMGLLVGHWYQNREAAGGTGGFGVMREHALMVDDLLGLDQLIF